ncbi:MAG TPA: molybdopterin-binding protein [Anaeromyxobacteraceae bacterium]|nr:molybdopterin-binding protein [Anaeromyxobacteraceae bacterium]
MPTPTAAVLVIGSEVLSAKVRDQNGPWLAGRLRELGVLLLSIRTLPDRTDAIVEALDAERRRVDWVFTCGGVGPTHDDLTLPAVALALGRPLQRSEPFAEALRAMHRRHGGGGEIPEAALRMADLPQGTRLLGDPGFPTLAVENVVMLPGVPEFLRQQFERIAGDLRGSPFRLANLYLALGEDRLATLLDRVARAHPRVEIGSYPRFDQADHRVRVTLEGKDEEMVRAALQAVLALLPPGAVVRSEGP